MPAGQHCLPHLSSPKQGTEQEARHPPKHTHSHARRVIHILLLVNEKNQTMHLLPIKPVDKQITTAMYHVLCNVIEYVGAIANSKVMSKRSNAPKTFQRYDQN